MKKITTLVFCIVITYFAAAQTQEESADYAKMKADLEQKIFDTPDPLFQSNEVPAEYKNESAVILAQKHTLESDSKKRFRMALWMPTTAVKFNFFETFREKIYINDKAALEEYSQLTFDKLQAKVNAAIGKSKYYTFINIRLIKPDGTIKKVDVDVNAVTLKDEKNAKQTKIAIPDLNTGDIIDYYVTSYYQFDKDEADLTYLTYILTADYPIINYELSLQFDKRIATEYQCINGAPEFTITPTADGEGNIMDLKAHNLSKSKDLIWVSLARVLPVVRVSYVLGDIKKGKIELIKPGEIVKASNKDDNAEEDYIERFYQLGLLSSVNIKHFNPDQIDGTEAALKKYSPVKADKMPVDSVCNFSFNYLKWYFDDAMLNLQTNYDQGYWGYELEQQRDLAFELSNVLKRAFEIKTQIVVLTGLESVKKEDAFQVGDFSSILRTDNNDKPVYFSFDDNMNLLNEIPASLEGQKAKLYGFEYDWMTQSATLVDNGDVTLPTSTYTDNVQSEKLNISLDAKDPQLINIKRDVTAKGHLRKDKQGTLTTFEGYATATAQSIGINDDLATINDNRKKATRVDGDELGTLIKNARTKQKDKFEDEIESTYDNKPKDLVNYKIIKPSPSLQDPSFEFNEEFTIEGLVKKAGNNYIIDAGKLIGGQLELKPEQKEKRTIDIYMPFARSFSYQVELNIPDGYTAEGTEKLNKNVENECGGFVSTAKVDGNKIVITVSKYYKNAFEPAANWDKIVAFVDEATQFSKEKILFKKQ
jgi:hypothetical protein